MNFKNNKVVPVQKNEGLTRKKTRQEKSSKIYNNRYQLQCKSQQNEIFHNKFIKEIIPCGYCKEKFNLGSNKLQIHCGKCNKFYHCHIGGKCRGDNCKVKMNNGNIEYLSYCLNCCDPFTISNGFCLCLDCKNINKKEKQIKYSGCCF